MRLASKIAASVAAVLVSTLGACASDDDGGSADPTAMSSTPSASPTAGDTRRCLRQQRYGTWPARDRLQALTQRVLSRPEELEPDAADRFARAVAAAARRARKACGGDVAELAAVVELATTAAGTVDEALLREVVDAFERWGRTIGRERATRIVYAADPCVPMREHVRASYEVRRRPESGGAAVSVVLVVVNDWSERVYLDHWGSVDATRVRPTGSTGTYQWGGSSADTAAAPAGRTTRRPVALVSSGGPEPGSALHLLRGGDVRVHDVGASAYSSVGPCRIDVERAD